MESSWSDVTVSRPMDLFHLLKAVRRPKIDRFRRRNEELKAGEQKIAPSKLSRRNAVSGRKLSNSNYQIRSAQTRNERPVSEPRQLHDQVEADPLKRLSDILERRIPRSNTGQREIALAKHDSAVDNADRNPMQIALYDGPFSRIRGSTGPMLKDISSSFVSDELDVKLADNSNGISFPDTPDRSCSDPRHCTTLGKSVSSSKRRSPDLSDVDDNQAEESAALNGRPSHESFLSAFDLQVEAIMSSDIILAAAGDLANANDIPKSKGKQRLIPIRDLDWSQLNEGEADETIKAYGASSFITAPTTMSSISRESSTPPHDDDANVPASRVDSALSDRSSATGLGRKHVLGQKWLNGQEFSNELSDFHLLEAAERQEEALREELKSLRGAELLRQVEEGRRRAEEAAKAFAKEAELERLKTEEYIRQLEEAAKTRLAKALAAARARQRECVVCGDSKDPFDFPTEAPTSKCDHPARTCAECLQAWMESEIETKGCDGITCPECAQLLEHNEIQAAASAETFAAYDKLAIRAVLGAIKEFAWCLKPDCGSGQLNIDNNTFMACISCGYKQCLTHKVPWHTGETCDQYEYRASGQQKRDEEKKTEDMLDTVSKKCPNEKCGWRIEKISGCEHMTCKKCKHEFCWLCLCSHAEIKRIGNTAHKVDCKFHSNNLATSWPFNAH